MARSLVCSIGHHVDCDGGAPNGPAGADSPCACRCHFRDRLETNMTKYARLLERLADA